MASYQILYWHDIPVQIRAQDASGRVNFPLPPRFQTAIDQAAMEAGLSSDEAYTALFHWGPASERQGSAREVAEAVAAEIIAQYATIDWHATVAQLKNGQ